MARSKKTIAFVVYPGITLLELVGTFSVLKGMAMKGYELFTVAEKAEPTHSDTPLAFSPDKTFDQLQNPNWLLVMGGEGVLQALENQALQSYVRKAAEGAELVGSVGTGSLILARGGLLRDHSATTHWAYAEMLEQLGARYVQKNWLEDGRFVTSAGAAGGVDMALHLLAKYVSPKLARQQQLMAEYDPEPPFGGIDWSHNQPERKALAALMFPNARAL